MSGWMGSEWVFAGGYFVVAGLSLIAMPPRRGVTHVGGGRGRFWPIVAICFFSMGVARASDIGDRLTAVGRAEAVHGGWYASRRSTQIILIIGIGLIWLLIVTVTWRHIRDRRSWFRPMFLATISTATFAGVRSVSLHQIDMVLNQTVVGPLRIGRLVELLLLMSSAAVVLRAIDGARARGPAEQERVRSGTERQ